MKQTLKTMAILLCAVAMVMMTSCSKETSYQNRIVGKWKLTKMTSLLDGQIYTGPGSASDSRWEPIEFKSNGTCIFGHRFVPKSNYEQLRAQYTIDDDEITATPYFWWKILELTNSRLVCQECYGDGDPGYGNFKYEFTKVN